MDQPLASMIGVLRRRRWLLIIAAVVGGGIGLLGGTVLNPMEARTRFALPGGGADVSRLVGLAAQFGFNVGSGQRGESVEFYAALLGSYDLLAAVVTAPYEATEAIPRTLVEWYAVEDADTTVAIRMAAERLRRRMQVSVDPIAGIVTVHLRDSDRDMAVAIARRLLDEVNTFNLTKRQTYASAERRFVEGRLEAAEARLRNTESALEAFHEQNRSLDSPRLRFEQARLERAVELDQQVYVSLAQAVESARIEEVRNIPVITVLERPEVTVARARDLPMTVLGGVLFAVALAAAVALGGQWLAEDAAVRA